MNGTLAYATNGGQTAQLTWFDRSGKPSGTVSTPGEVSFPKISPDGTMVSFARNDPTTGVPDIWLHDLSRHADSRFTFGPRFNLFPVWSPDGSHIAYMATDETGLNIHQKATSGPGQDEVIDATPRVKRPLDWSHDGKYIIEDTPDTKSATDIWVLPLEGDKKPFPYLNSSFNESWAKLSPDGHWLAYMSDESKRPEIYVQSFPMPGGKWQVSIGGGNFPIWSRDGKELFFLSLDQKMMAAEVRSTIGKNGLSFERNVPKPMFEPHLDPNAGYDVSKDGKFLVPVPVEQSGSSPINIVINWPLALKK